jgi:membrane dipeptidase
LLIFYLFAALSPKSDEVIILMKLIDAHCDTITSLMRRGEELLDNTGNISLKKLEAFDAPVIFFAVFMHLKNTPEPFAGFLKAYDFLLAQTEKNKDRMAIAKSSADISANMSKGLLSAVPAIEEGGVLEGKMENLYKAHELGVKYITLTWNFPNEIGEPSALDGGGLTDFGKSVIAEMNGLDMLIDVSHLSEKGFWDVNNLSKKPFVASHSNAKTLCGHSRNLTDDQLKALGEKGGVAGINFCPAFLRDDAEAGAGADIDDVCRHLEHMIKHAGENGVGLGTDFDGISTVPRGLEDASKLPGLWDVMMKRYGAELTEKVFFGNFWRVLQGAE